MSDIQMMNLVQGKTLLMVLYAKLWLANKKPVFANFHVNGGQIMRAEYFRNLNVIENSLALLDERLSLKKLVRLAYEWFESRFSGSEVNRILSHRIFQSRKRGVDIIHSSQLASSIDLRLRRLTSTLIWAVRPSEDAFNYVYFTPEGTYNRSISMDLARKLFTQYDTREMVIEEGAQQEAAPKGAKTPKVEEPNSDFNNYVKQLHNMQKSFTNVSSRLVKQINMLQVKLENTESRMKKLELLIEQRPPRRVA